MFSDPLHFLEETSILLDTIPPDLKSRLDELREKDADLVSRS